MMSSKDSMALAVGQAMLDRIAASAPELSGVGDMDGDVIPADPDVDEPGTGVEPVDGTLVFDYLLREQLVLERDLAERGYFIDDPVHDGLVFVTDEHVNVRCFVGAVVEQEDGRRFAIEFTPPFVDRLIRGNAQRPLADRFASALISFALPARRLASSATPFASAAILLASCAIRFAFFASRFDLPVWNKAKTPQPPPSRPTNPPKPPIPDQTHCKKETRPPIGMILR